MRSHRLPSLILVLLVPAALAADDKEPRVVERLDLSTFDAPAVVHGPVLAAPSDLPEGDALLTSWGMSDYAEKGATRAPWLEFDSGDQVLAFEPDSLVEALRWGGALDDDPADVSVRPGVLVVGGRAEQVKRVRDVLPWAHDMLAPSAHVRASLVTGSEGALLAQGGARLWPGRWTRLWLQEDRPSFTVDWNIGIAQESTVMNPYVTVLCQGQELYMRWAPGETLSVLEVWSGDLEHLDAIELDFSVLRNVPEASGPGLVRVPRTAIRRAYTAVALDAAGGTAHLVWSGPHGERRLTLTLDRVTESPTPTPASASGRVLAQLRTGALSSGMLFDARTEQTDALQGELHLASANEGEVLLNQMPGESSPLLLYEGPAEHLGRMRSHLMEREAALPRARLALRTLTVPEDALRAAVAQGEITSGAPLPASVADRLRAQGVAGEGVALPILFGVTAGFRCGASVPGLVTVRSEVAQSSGGLDPVMGARFSGLAGEALLGGTARLLHLRVNASLEWADPKAGLVTLTFRSPVGMAFNREKVGAESDTLRRAALPTLAGGSAEIDASFDVPAGDKAERLVGMAVLGGEAVLLLASLEGR